MFNYQKAVSYLDKAIEQKSNDGEYYYNRGFAKIQLGKKDEGCKDLKKALELNFYPAQKLLNQYCQHQNI